MKLIIRMMSSSNETFYASKADSDGIRYRCSKESAEIFNDKVNDKESANNAICDLQ